MAHYNHAKCGRRGEPQQHQYLFRQADSQQPSVFRVNVAHAGNFVSSSRSSTPEQNSVDVQVTGGKFVGQAP